MATIYSLPRALIVGTPKVRALHPQDTVRCETKDPKAVNPWGLKTELIGRSARSRHSCSQLLAAITAPFEVGHFTATYPDSFPRSKQEIQLEKQAIAQAGKRYGLAGVWTLEFQKRGAPHWHMLLWQTIPGAAEKFCTWWQGHTNNPASAAILVSSGDEGKAGWYFNFHQCKEYQTPPVRVGRWWGVINGQELKKWIHCKPVASTMVDRDVVWMKRVARRSQRAAYRGQLCRFLSRVECQGKSGDPRVIVGSYYRDGKEYHRRKVHRCRVAKSSLGPQGFTWFLREEQHMRVLQWVAKVQERPYANPF
jgi:hypothetical protein